MHDTHINIHRQPLHVFCDAKLRRVRSSSALGLWLINSRYRSRYLYLQRNTFWGRMVQYKWNLTAWTLKADTRCYRFLWNVYDIKKQKKRLIPSFSTLCIQLEVRKLNGGSRTRQKHCDFFYFFRQRMSLCTGPVARRPWSVKPSLSPSSTKTYSACPVRNTSASMTSSWKLHRLLARIGSQASAKIFINWEPEWFVSCLFQQG